MRITPQTLLKIARDTVNQRVKTERDILSAYLCGSVVTGNPLLGGTTDIDLIFIHNGSPALPREIVPLTEAVSLDLVHLSRSEYREGRLLRQHPRWGPTIYAGRILYDPQHFMDFLQAGVRGHFHRPDNVLARAQSLLADGRQVWLDFYYEPPQPSPAITEKYLRAVECAANALASLNGAPLPDRRLLVEFPARAEAVGRAGMSLGVLGLLGGHAVELETLQSWLSPWLEALEAVAATWEYPQGLHPARRDYYRRAVETHLESDQPQAALWPLIYTWTRAVNALPEGAPAIESWENVCRTLEIYGDGFEGRVAALDVFLDTVEEALEEWALLKGA